VYPPLHLRTEADPVSQTSCDLVILDIRTMHKVQKPVSSQHYIPSSESFRNSSSLPCSNIRQKQMWEAEQDVFSFLPKQIYTNTLQSTATASSYTYPRHQALQHQSLVMIQLSSSHQEAGDHSEVDDMCRMWCVRGCLQIKGNLVHVKVHDIDKTKARFIKSMVYYKMADGCHTAQNCIIIFYIQNWHWLKTLTQF
jgi:hypothetical protein